MFLNADIDFLSFFFPYYFLTHGLSVNIFMILYLKQAILTIHLSICLPSLIPKDTHTRAHVHTPFTSHTH